MPFLKHIMLQGESLTYSQGKSRYDVFGFDIYKDGDFTTKIGKKELVEIVARELLGNTFNYETFIEYEKILRLINVLAINLNVRLKKRWVRKI